MLNTLETQQKVLSDAVGVINSKLDLMFSGVAGVSPGGLPTAPPPPPPPPTGGYGPVVPTQQPPYSSAPHSGQYSSSDQYGGTELYVRPPDPDLESSHTSRAISRDRPGSDHSGDTHASLSFIPEEKEDGGGNASETDSVIHGQCSDPDDECSGRVSIDEEEIVPQKAVTAEQKPPRKRSKKRRTSSSSSVESALLSPPPGGVSVGGVTSTSVVAEVRGPYFTNTSPRHTTSSPASSLAGSTSSAATAGGEQFKPRYISNTEELNKLVRLLEPHS